MRNRFTATAILMMALGFAFLPACSSRRNLTYSPNIPPLAETQLEAALHAGIKQVPSKLEAVVRKYPNYVEAHRHLQNLYMAENRYGYLVNRYRHWKDRYPDSAEYNYLYGRLFSNPENQIDAFSEAVDMDYSFYWGYNGLGYAYRSSGELSRSEEAFKMGIQSAPDRPEAYVGLISLYMLNRRYDEAADLIARALQRFPDHRSPLLLHYQYLTETEGPLVSLEAQANVAPEVELDASYFDYLLRTVDKASTERLLQKILYRFGPLAEQEVAYRDTLDLLLGVCCRKLGYLDQALRHYSRVYAASPAHSRVRRELRFLLTVTGRIEEALVLQTSGCPAEWVEQSRYQEAEVKLLALAASLQKPQRGFTAAENAAETVLELASLLVHLGWLDEAAAYLSRIADQRSDAGREGARLLEEIYRHRNLELALREFFLKQYRKYRQEDTGLELEEVIERLGEISERTIGKNIFTDLTFIDCKPAGMLLDSRRGSSCGPAEYFRRFNRFFLLGHRIGGPVEAYLLDIFDYPPEQEYRVGETAFNFDLVRCENLRIPSFIEYQGGVIVGVGLHSILLVNLDMIRFSVQNAQDLYDHFHENESQLLKDPPPQAARDSEVTLSEEPYGLSRRLDYLSFKRYGSRGGVAAYMESRFDALVKHEVRHLADAREFLPLTKDLMWKLFKFTAKGFSRFKIQAWLEERAQLYALLTAEDPYCVLSDSAEHLQNGSLQSPHRVGYGHLLERIVERIYQEPDRFNTIDRKANILHQLHRLTLGEVRSIARELALEEDLIQEE